MIKGGKITKVTTNLHKVRSSYVDFLSELITQNNISLQKYLSHNDSADETELSGLLTFLELFNATNTRADGKDKIIKVKPGYANDFLKSLVHYLKEEFTLIANWKALQTTDELLQEDILSWGSLFLRAMEKRRVSQSTTKQPLAEVNITLFVIKAKVEGYKNPMYLCQFNTKILRYQMIGGYKKVGEDDRRTIRRLLIKELPFNKIQTNRYKVKPIEKNVRHYEIARKTNIYTKYNFSFYHVLFNFPFLKPGHSDRWIGLDEFINEMTVDGIPLLSPLKPFIRTDNKRLFLDRLKNLSLSFAKEQPKGPNTKIKLPGPLSLPRGNRLKEILGNEESEKLEFKSSLRWDYSINSLNKGLEKVVIKTLGAFLNSGGGTLVLGVDDDKQITGIAKDLATFRKKNTDGFFQHLISLISSYIGAEFTSFAQITFENIENKTICIVKIKSSPNPVFVKEGEQRSFYIRSGNSSRELNPEEVFKYIQLHW
jgi:hypothetical protein